jgi:hypothetical protein
MPMVFVTQEMHRKRGTKISHKSLYCKQLRKPTRLTPVEVELSELARPRPCYNCYPDAPRAVSVHRVCFVCNTDRGPRPCPHNGGVLIHRERVIPRPGVKHDPGDHQVVNEYVWPEALHLYVS